MCERNLKKRIMKPRLEPIYEGEGGLLTSKNSSSFGWATGETWLLLPFSYLYVDRLGQQFKKGGP